MNVLGVTIAVTSGTVRVVARFDVNVRLVED